MRGAPFGVGECRRKTGIIPADAGITFLDNMCRPRPGGSSPRMRGARWMLSGDVNAGRIIPADAGSTSARRSGWYT